MANASRPLHDADFNVGTEEQVEKLIADLSHVIRTADPERRAGLKELAKTLLHEEFSTITDETRRVESEPSRSRFNPLASGILLVIFGLGFLLIVPLVDVTRWPPSVWF
jgi:hypothetical protein